MRFLSDRFLSFAALTAALSFCASTPADAAQKKSPGGAPSSERLARPAQPSALKWQQNPTSLSLEQGVGVELTFGGEAKGAADLKLSGRELLSETGAIAVVAGKELETLANLPSGGYRPGIPVEELFGGLAVVRLPGGRYAKLQMGSFSEALNGGGYQAISITYYLSALPAKQDAAVEKVDSRLVGRWKLRIPAGVAYSPVRPDGTQTLSLTPGAGMGILTLRADGRYAWEGIYWTRDKKIVRGQVRRARPASARSGMTFWKISDGKNGYLLTWEKENRLPFTVLYSTGGFVAGGERVQ